MYVDKDGRVVIDDHFVCEFMRSGSDEFMASCESVIKAMCLACNHKTTSDAAEFMSLLAPWGKKMMDTISSQKVDVSDVVRVLTEFRKEIGNESVALNAKVDNLKDKIDFTKVIDTSLKRNDEMVMSTWEIFRRRRT